MRTTDRRASLIVALVAGLVLVVVLIFTVPVAAVAVPALVVTVARVARSAGGGLQIDQIDRLRKAELSLAAAPTTEAAAKELADEAIALLGARSAVVLIEGIGDTVRVGAGDATGTMVYGEGSRMRLLDDDGVPCGSIAVSARADGRAYTDRDERILDALAQRVSSTLHRLSLFTEINAERRTLEDVLTSSSDGIFSVGSDLRVRSWNPAMASITGVRAEDAIGEPSSKVFRPVSEDGIACHGQADPGRKGRTVESLLVSIDDRGQTKWLTCSWSPLTEGGYVVVARDETERKKVQDDKDGWIAQVSHELRTPLTPIKGFLHTLARRDDQLTSDDRAKIYEVMLREQRRLEDLVNSLLQATTLDQELGVIVPEVVDWKALVEEQVDHHARLDPTREFDVAIARGLPNVVTDSQLAGTVLRNLLSNALKYGDESGPVTVEVRKRGTMVMTTVSDTGPGIPAADRERVFEKFTRLGDHLTRPQQGVGLGLYIAKQAVEACGGEIQIGDAPGGGAAITFTLPAHRAQPSKRSPAGGRRTRSRTAS